MKLVCFLIKSRFCHSLACVASVSARVRRERRDESKRKGMTGEEKEGTACPQTHDFEKLRSPTNAATDWCGVGSVDYLALETSIKPGMLCLRASQIWSHLICGRRLQMLWTDIYLNRVCAKVYEIRVFKVYLEIEQWRLGKASLLGRRSEDLTGKKQKTKTNGCLLEITST